MLNMPSPRPRLSMDRLIFMLALAIGAAGLPACKPKDQPNPAKAMMNMPVPVEVAPVRVGNLEQRLTAVGSLSSPEETVIAPQVAGKIIYLNIPQGQTVARGTLLVRLDSGPQQAAQQAAAAALANARQIYQRDQQLVGIGGVSAQQLQTELSAVHQAQAQLEQTRSNLQYTTIKAPFTGELGLRKISVGSFVAPGNPIVNLRSLNPLYLDFDLPQQNITQVKAGQIVHFRVEGLPNLYQGRVQVVDSSVNTGARSIHVRATVPNPDRTLKPGMFASTELVISNIPNALFVPMQAIVAEGDIRRVWILNAKNQPVPITVTVGNYQDNWVQILSGLRAGDRVLTTGMEKLHPNAKLVIKPYQPIHNERLDLSKPRPQPGGEA